MVYYHSDGALTTAVKSFDGPQLPDLTGLAYATNGETITLTVVGSPGTAAEESHTVTLTGQTSVDLAWDAGHTEFALELALSTTDNAVSPTVDDLGLQSVTVAPAGLTATGEAGAVGLNWPAAPTATSYNVYRAEASGATVGDYALVGTTDSAGYVDDAVEDGERYYYRVSGGSPDAGESALTDEAVATVPVSAPVLDALDASLREITLSLTLPDDSTDGDLLIERSLDGASWTEHATIDDLSVTEWVDTGLLDGEVYHYRLTRRTDHASSQSAVLDARTPMPNPTDFRIVDVDGDQFDVQMRDRANHKDGYRVWRGPDGFLSFGGLDSGEYVEAPSDPLQSLDTEITIAVEVEPTALDVTTDNDYRRVCHQGDRNERNSLLFEEDGIPNGSVSVNGERVGSRGYGGAFEEGERATVIFTYNANTGDFHYYKSAEHIYTDTAASGTLDTFGDTFIISSTEGSRQFAGNVYRVTYADYVWGQAEVDEYEAGGVPGDPLIHYEFNQGSGDTLTDYSGNDNDGTLVNSPTWVEGGPMVQDGGDLDPEWSLRDLGVDVGVEANVTQAIQDTIDGDSFTIAFWFDPYDTLNGDSWNDFVRFPTPSSVARFEENSGSEDTASWFWPSTEWDGNSHLGDIHTTEPVHVALTYGNGQEFATLQDGEVVKSGTEGLEGVGSGTFQVGAAGNGPFGIDDFLISDQELSPSQVRDAMAGKDVPGQVLRWRCNDGPGSNTVVDQMGEEDGNIVGAATWNNPPMAPIRHTTENLSDGERYILRGSAFTEHAESFDR